MVVCWLVFIIRKEKLEQIILKVLKGVQLPLKKYPIKKYRLEFRIELFLLNSKVFSDIL